ncbi:hypothetical protein [Deinococcus sonorensis]|uniref:DUF4132 domain-containing protein n=2 Tax=Deinococcus sonorensis TaxID=309891 RepID=A0AAU7UFS6_9DEIO
MADKSGKSYEAFVEYLLMRLGYANEASAKVDRQYLFGTHRLKGEMGADLLDKYSESGIAFHSTDGLPHGPWYNPDFFVLENGLPAACLHVTHWSNPRSSKYKFWRTQEEHLQYKIAFGHKFLSINLVFEAIPGNEAELITDTQKKIFLHGWDPSIGSILVGCFDATLLFPLHYWLIKEYESYLPEKLPQSPLLRRQALVDSWTKYFNADGNARAEIDLVLNLLRNGMNSDPHPRYSSNVINHLQSITRRGRERAVLAKVRSTRTRYRKGIQHAFIVREMISRLVETDADAATWNIIRGNARFRDSDWLKYLGLSVSVSQSQSVLDALQSIPIQMADRRPIFLLKIGGIEIFEWNEDFQIFISDVAVLPEDEAKALFKAMLDLFEDYRSARGMTSVLADLAEPKRISRKIQYVFDNYIGVGEKQSFVNKLSADMLTPGQNAPHQQIVLDSHNWVLDVLLSAHNLGSVQTITSRLPALFFKHVGEEINPYSYQGGPENVVARLLAGRDIGPDIRPQATMSREEFYEVIWPLIAMITWESISGIPHSDKETVIENYRYKKAMRIISSPDLEPMRKLLHNAIPGLDENAPPLRGSFNKLSTLREWSNSALTTEVSGREATSGIIIQTQAVYGAKHIADKTKEIACRLRSIHIKCNDDGLFEPEPNPGKHYLVIDGDWPLESKINLYEAGFDGIYDVSELIELSSSFKK